MQRALRQNKQMVAMGITILIAIAIGGLLVSSSNIFLFVTLFSFGFPLMLITCFFSIKRLALFARELSFVHIPWILLFLGLLMFKSRTAQEAIDNPVGVQQWLRIIPALFAGLIAFFLTLKENKLSLILRGPLLFFLLYCLSALISVFFSVYKAYSLWKALELIIAFAAVSSIISSSNSSHNVKIVNSLNFTWNNILLVTVMIGAVFIPTSAFKQAYGAIVPQLHGVYPIINANSVGLMAAVALVFLISKVVDGEYKIVHVLSAAIVFFIIFLLAQSRTSMVGLSISLIVYLFIRKKIKWLGATAIALLFMILSGKSADLLSSYVLRGQTTESASVRTLSGRTEGWVVALDKFYESPLWGHGYAAGARYTVLGTIPGREDQTGLHNAFLDVLANNGLIGFIPWVTAFLWTLVILLKQSVKDPSDRFSPLFVSILILFFVRMTTGDSLVYHDNTTLMFLGIVAYAQLVYLKKI